MASLITTLQSKLGYSSQKALLLGAGFVTKPTVQILADAGVEVTVACRTIENAKKLSEGIKNTRPVSLDVSDAAALDAEVEKVDLVISLIPYTFHATVIKSAIRKKKNVVTTSYVSPAMMELDAQAKEAGITVMNEIGLDPGIDHLYAVKTIEEVHKEGGSITSFESYCGGLPAPEASGNTGGVGYRFSWSSRGVLLALRNSAKYYKDGKVVDIPGPELMASANPYYIYPGFAFVGYPNRDSTPYRERYNIPEAKTVVRGTLRYQGFPEIVKVLVDIGFLSEEEQPFLKSSEKPITWAEATQKIIGSSSNKESDLTWAIASKHRFKDDEEKQRIISGLRWLGLFSDKPITPRGNPLDTLCATLEEKLQYEKGQRDMVMLQHKFEIEHKDGSKETRTSTLVDYGDPNGYSSMAKLVGVPCGVACLMVLDGRIKQKGILAPVTWELAEPLLTELKEKYGIYLTEETVA
ncbi:saccharopine dehydrogenase (NADP+, L-glutamate-forming) [Elasticomyces elasticus]|uniref:Saccharopine dehydrogenase (NADP+, L-glutamate-forming) n=1 Tax=Exophiala sideris TaxID=1016849 RepID=A0ABR0J1S9_9EURO|nr:saccharopine dehydrogenase (NADP+, L-glutamate-forming) [Elasticomyces elasticus]KAK5024445.1 saccharopine dehydrogenase (NADP+, L-glutamate-forming) [Exophiala sideris]KAK5030873.1 saccharopine dehydrogenase (NADP+, L-glutamate-forming) [Exophiala sideris]KAK5054178.1 saccharopine dehydrogenase (NADP+, L-glutamate-forming) [Exophiala sideris]KAK5179466.1 saccharopine dehydrogenase (NADP+, L-glutamate-forming) [Eurotiomycetes sp. CCFEE 6388]